MSSPKKGPSDLKKDLSLDQQLRPENWSDYIGQEQIKNNLRILLSAALERGHSPEHLLFHGPAGLGKTTISYLIARETGSQIKITSGAAIEKVGDLASILTNLSTGDILFIDEIHRLNKAVEEILYPAMESGSLDIIIGKGPSARTVQLELSPFTLVAATTRVAMISSPLRSRFSGGIFKLDFYSDKEIEEIIKKSTKKLRVKIEKPAIEEIAKRSRSTPRMANYLLKRCRDFSQVENKKLDKETVLKTFELLGIDEFGLTSADRNLLRVVADKFGGGPVGINTIATALSEEIDTIEEVYEPYLIRLGFLERTSRGRVITESGRKCVGK
jgi:Holliday junction DNA helicase RuvB